MAKMDLDNILKNMNATHKRFSEPKKEEKKPTTDEKLSNWCPGCKPTTDVEKLVMFGVAG